MGLLDRIVDVMVGAGRDAGFDARVLLVDRRNSTLVYMDGDKPIAVAEITLVKEEDIFGEQDIDVVLFSFRIMLDEDTYGLVEDKVVVRDVDKALEDIRKKTLKMLRTGVSYILAGSLKTYNSKICFKHGCAHARIDNDMNIHLELEDVYWEKILENTALAEKVLKITGIHPIIKCLENRRAVNLVFVKKRVVRKMDGYRLWYETAIGDRKSELRVWIGMREMDIDKIHEKLDECLGEWLNKAFRDEHVLAEIFRLCAGV